MNLQELLNDKTIKPKVKTEQISNYILNEELSVTDLIKFATTQKDSPKATCIEALEFATQKKPELLNKSHFEFIVQSLLEKAPRVKWESAKVIGNTAHLHSKELDQAITNLLKNSEFDGTVVRWSAAFALGEILKLKTKHNKELLPAIEAIVKREDQNSIRKIYLAAIKAITK